MATDQNKQYSHPMIFNVFKPPRMTSYDVVRYFKKNLPQGYGKIGHFGTLDPFACGVLLLGVAGASRLNNFIHQYLPKTYLAIGKLGKSSITGDLTVKCDRQDDSKYFNQVISSFTKEFIQKRLQEKFLGDYFQSPPLYSAAKYQGRPLHQWAREGIEIKKEKKLRKIYSLKVVKFRFPYLILRIKVSSGTYIRTLFQDCAEYLGTFGVLISLVRESIGYISYKDSLKKNLWPCENQEFDLKLRGLSMGQVLPFNSLYLSDNLSKRYINGQELSLNLNSKIKTNGLQEGLKLPLNYNWIFSERNVLLGLGSYRQDNLKSIFNLSSAQ